MDPSAPPQFPPVFSFPGSPPQALHVGKIPRSCAGLFCDLPPWASSRPALPSNNFQGCLSSLEPSKQPNTAMGHSGCARTQSIRSPMKELQDLVGTKEGPHPHLASLRQHRQQI
jgi:hypothetical protein